jgi:hypothetical protein
VVKVAPAQGLPTERERISLDTNVFIYFLEDHPRYGSGAHPCSTGSSEDTIQP